VVVDDFVVLAPVGAVVLSVGTGTVVVVFVEVLVDEAGPGVTTGVLSWMTVVELGAVSTSGGGLLTSHPVETSSTAPVRIAATVPFIMEILLLVGSQTRHLCRWLT
jgi:hypothetical protein